MKAVSSFFMILLCKAAKKVPARVRKYIKEEKMKKRTCNAEKNMLQYSVSGI